MNTSKIKGAHWPRLILAVIAILLFFATLLLEWTSQNVDFTQPAWGYVMLGFLLVGIGMLVASWMIGFDTWGEWIITLVMIGLHIIFDGYMLVYVRFLGNPIPIPIIQLVIQGYWLAGLLDVLAMFWAQNLARLEKTSEAPEAILRREYDQLKVDHTKLQDEHNALKQDHAVLQTTHDLEVKSLTASSQDAHRMLIEAQQRIDQMIADANRVFTAVCDDCGREFTGKTQRNADAARDGHKRTHTTSPKPPTPSA